jgi:hypothetical protein
MVAMLGELQLDRFSLQTFLPHRNRVTHKRVYDILRGYGICSFVHCVERSCPGHSSQYTEGERL